MILQGKLFAESPIYRGNARKTLFTRDGDGTQRLVSLAGEVAGTAQSLMDAFVGKSRDGKNIGLINYLWFRLYRSPMPENLITGVECRLQEECYPRDQFFDLRMGIKLDEDRWCAEANANYKFETLFRNSAFDLKMKINDSVLHDGENQARLYYVLQELIAGRFWYGAGKSKGLGRCRLDMSLPFPAPAQPPSVHAKANHLTLSLSFNVSNPLLVGWNWGKVDPEVPAFAAIEGRLLVESMRDLPQPVRQRLEMAIGGPILNPEDWKAKLAEFLPRVIAVWLRERSTKEAEGWVFPSPAVRKLGKGKFPLSKKVIERLEPLLDRPYSSRDEATTALNEVLGKKANMAKRVMTVLAHTTQTVHQFDTESWSEIAASLGLEQDLAARLAPEIDNEAAAASILSQACRSALPNLLQQVDRQVRLLQSDAWINVEIAEREEHILIKNKLAKGEISQEQWGNPEAVPEGIRGSTWREFVNAHARVKYQHMLNPRNLHKSITNDRNHIAFLNAYRDRARQELAQSYNTDFRAGGIANREISRKHGKPFDTIFMRMLTWVPASQDKWNWQVYVPGSTIKGAFRKRASQVLKTLWGESRKTTETLDKLFGTMGQRGLVFFSDAYLANPKVPDGSWCSMDGVRMDPRTAEPVEESKADYLFACGDKLAFNLRIDLQDIDERDWEALGLLLHLLRDFKAGEIPLGGEKTNGLGWVEAHVTEINWMTTNPNDTGKKLFGEHKLARNGLWHSLTLKGTEAEAALAQFVPIAAQDKAGLKVPARTSQGFITHRAFGGHCGTLALEGEVLTPIHVQESGEPSFVVRLDDGPVNGWDFFSLAPPEAQLRGSTKVYALPSKSIKGMIRHLYAIATDAHQPSPDITHLNPVDSLFGFVGTGPNQALMGRVTFSFARFGEAELGWFKVPYPYGAWQFQDGEWKHSPKSRVRIHHIDETWRLFLHTPLAPNVTNLQEFRPDTSKASYLRAILPGARCRFTIRFWNLEQEELQRLIWCLVLEPGLAHKIGKARYLGFGSLRLQVMPESYLTDWTHRYAGSGDNKWQVPIKQEDWIKPEVIRHYAELKKALDAKLV